MRQELASAVANVPLAVPTSRPLTSTLGDPSSRRAEGVPGSPRSHSRQTGEAPITVSASRMASRARPTLGHSGSNTSSMVGFSIMARLGRTVPYALIHNRRVATARGDGVRRLPFVDDPVTYVRPARKRRVRGQNDASLVILSSSGVQPAAVPAGTKAGRPGLLGWNPGDTVVTAMPRNAGVARKPSKRKLTHPKAGAAPPRLSLIHIS